MAQEASGPESLVAGEVFDGAPLARLECMVNDELAGHSFSRRRRIGLKPPRSQRGDCGFEPRRRDHRLFEPL